MSSNENTPSSAGPRQRRGSVTNQTFSSLFTRTNTVSGAPTAPFPGPIATAAVQDQRRRMSTSTLGLSGTSPTQTASFTFSGRRGSVSTANSEATDENAIDDEDGGRSNPTTPYGRRMSYGAQVIRGSRAGSSPGISGRTPSYTDTSFPSITSGRRSSSTSSGSQSGGVAPSHGIQASMQSQPRTTSDLNVSPRPGEGVGFNWSEQLRYRAESSVSQNQRPSFSTSPNSSRILGVSTERAGGINEMPTPPMAVPAPAPPKQQPRKPDDFQERILKGDFYMD